MKMQGKKKSGERGYGRGGGSGDRGVGRCGVKGFGGC